MNDTYINYIDKLLDLAERNDIFCLTSRDFSEFSAEVLEALEKQKPMKPTPCKKALGICESCEDFVSRLDNYCPNCGQSLDWRIE